MDGFCISLLISHQKYLPIIHGVSQTQLRETKNEGRREKIKLFLLFMIIESTSNGSLNFDHQIPGIKNRHLLVDTP